MSEWTPVWIHKEIARAYQDVNEFIGGYLLKRISKDRVELFGVMRTNIFPNHHIAVVDLV